MSAPEPSSSSSSGPPNPNPSKTPSPSRPRITGTGTGIGPTVSPSRVSLSTTGPPNANAGLTSPTSPTKPPSGAWQGTLDILSKWTSIVTAPSVYQRQQDEEFWRSGPGAGIVRQGQTIGVPRPGARDVAAADSSGLMQHARRAAQPTSFRPGVTQSGKTIILPVRVEPKVQFANERTFLGWMHYGVILTTMAMTLLNYGDRIAQITGLIFTMFALLTMLYGLILFLWRGHRIRQRVRMPYDDLKGPPTLMAVLFVGTFVNFAVRWAQLARESNNGDDGGGTGGL